MTSTPAHLPRPASKEPPPHAPNAALLIDFDNVTMGIRSDLQTELKRLLSSDLIKGKVAVQRAYADWRRYPQYVAPLTASSIDLIWAPAYGTTKKNATDIRLAIDALELVFIRPEIGTFILLSGDSDFSSLVIKLKEYGKYVIGVGIRESSSDLLVQNCDEYYSYNELAGLTKETDLEHERRDPWELVIEAVKQMTAHNDVMRSDRLKQVMQELDPNFDEKDVGFSRFSKFVLEAQKRGLIQLTRLDNGQYEIALGPDSGGAPAAAPAGGERTSRRRAERAEPETAGGRRSGFSLGEAFGLLKQALGRVGANEPVTAEDLREAMVELQGDREALAPSRFPRLLRQAHDAEIIDLSKEEDGGYQVRLRGESGANDESPATAPAGETSGGAARSTRFRRGSRGSRPTPAPESGGTAMAEQEPRPLSPEEAAASYEAAGTDAEVPLPPGVTSRPDLEGTPPMHDGRSIRGRRGRGRGLPRPSGAEPSGEGRGPETGPRTDRPFQGAREDRPHRGTGQGRRGDPQRGERDRNGDAEGPRRRRRGGRGRGGRESHDGFEGRGSRDARESRGRPPAERGGSRSTPAPEAASSPPAPPPRQPAPASEGESFWTRVKRGLIGE
jgi:uncharacterized LabA/DUF88 family protein